jgi:hypothetical protein
VFLLNIKINPDHDEAQDILDALREIQDSPELQADARTNPESVLNRLGLSGVARHAVAFVFTVGLVVPNITAHVSTTDGFWGG